MKKLLTVASLGVIGLAISSAPALAEHHIGGEKHDKGKRFEKMDINGDGAISKEEFIMAHEKRFNELDTNSDGTVSKEEAAAKRKEMHDKMKERIKERRAAHGDKVKSAE